MATAIDKSLQRFNDPAAWDALPDGKHYEENIPIFLAHDLYRKPLQTPDGKVAYAEVAVPPGQKPAGPGWQFSYSVTEEHLRAIASAINQTYQQQDTPVTWKIGHTIPGQLFNQQAQPKATGFGVGATVGVLPGGRKAVLQSKVYHLKGCLAENRKYHHRSVEFDPVSLGISDVAFLATKPKLNMGVNLYQDPSVNWAEHYAQSGSDGAAALVTGDGHVHYGFELPPIAVPYADDMPGGPPKPADPTNAPDAAGPDQGKIQMFRALMKAAFGTEEPWKGAAPAMPGTPPMPPPPPAMPPMPGMPPAAPSLGVPPAHPPVMPQHPPAPAPLTPPRPGAIPMANELPTQFDAKHLEARLAALEADKATLTGQVAALQGQLTAQQQQYSLGIAEENVASLVRSGFKAFYDAQKAKQEVAYQSGMTDTQRQHRMQEIRGNYRQDTSRNHGDPTLTPTVPVLAGSVNHDPLQAEFGYHEADADHANNYMNTHPNCEWDDAKAFALKKRGVGITAA